ncbi:MAG: hypothetical protein HZA52_11020 [Planctomycetes bacterium]|nr:hypothetical protein [Planctomycetota bacterium]
MRLVPLVCSLAILASSAEALPLPQSVYRVDYGAPSNGDGLSWATAFQHLDDAIAAAFDGDEIWVTSGTYRPRVETQPGILSSSSIVINRGVRIIGSFAGNETTHTPTGPSRSTSLDGNLGFIGTAFHVVTIQTASKVRIENCTILGGQAQSDPTNDGGGGITMLNGGALMLVDDEFFVCDAANGAALDAASAFVNIRNCLFTYNNAANGGGAIRLANSSGFLYFSRFELNSAGVRGGAIHTSGLLSGQSDTLSVVGCVFNGNVAGTEGACGYVEGVVGAIPAARMRWSSCTFFGNDAPAGGAIAAEYNPSQPANMGVSFVTNCIIWNNSYIKHQLAGRQFVEYSCVQLGHPGVGNLSVKPTFLDPTTGEQDWGSVTNDAGHYLPLNDDPADVDEDGVTAEPIAFDLVGNPRFADDPSVVDTGCCSAPMCDMGAFER